MSKFRRTVLLWHVSTCAIDSGARTNSKVGAHVRREIYLLCPSTLLALHVQLVGVQLVVLASAFVIQYSLVSFLFADLLLTMLHTSPFVTVKGHVPPCPMGVGATGCRKVLAVYWEDAADNATVSAGSPLFDASCKIFMCATRKKHCAVFLSRTFPPMQGARTSVPVALG